MRHFDDLPGLPSGYFGSFLLAWIPWLWYRTMDPKLVALPHIDGDLSRINIDPDKADDIYRRFGGKEP